MRHIFTAIFIVAFATAAYADGAAIYAAKCKICHGAAGEGSKIAPDPITGKTADVVKKAITEGKDKMKPVKLEAADVDAVAAFVAGLK